MNNEVERMKPEDVISTKADPILLKNRTFMVSEMIAALMSAIKKVEAGLTVEKERWFYQGIDCKILKPGAKNWRKERIRFTLEFCSEEPEVTEIPENDELQPEVSSPLDELRQIINQDS